MPVVALVTKRHGQVVSTRQPAVLGTQTAVLEFPKEQPAPQPGPSLMTFALASRVPLCPRFLRVFPLFPCLAAPCVAF